jgi:hypothetical protein
MPQVDRFRQLFRALFQPFTYAITTNRTTDCAILLYVLRRQFIQSAALIPGIIPGILQSGSSELPDEAPLSLFNRQNLTAARSETLRLLITTPQPHPPLQDPKAKALYHLARHVYLEEGARLRRRFIIHTADPLTSLTAMHTARFLGALWRRIESRLTTLPTKLRQGHLDVWLCPNGDAGGEQFDRHILLYNPAEPRSDLEWTRELCHEYGHWLLPSPAHYTAPEPWANGLLGERLFIAWLENDITNATLAPADIPWAGTADLRYYLKRQTHPLIQRIHNRPPSPALLAQNTPEAMDAYTALMLHTENLHGPRALFDILIYLPKSPDGKYRGDHFLQAVQHWAAAEPRPLRAASPSEIRLYLPKGRTQIQGELDAAPLDTNIRRLPDGTLHCPNEGWFRLSVRSARSALLLPPA